MLNSGLTAIYEYFNSFEYFLIKSMGISIFIPCILFWVKVKVFKNISFNLSIIWVKVSLSKVF
jgi:hypothetical protein